MRAQAILRRIARIVAAIFVGAGIVLLLNSVANASTTHVRERIRAYDWALHQRGKWYQFGGSGPNTFDCSGLVMRAWEHAGVHLPRTTFEMLGSRHLIRVIHPRKGDLAFFGSGHVELYAFRHHTFGAHSTGQRIGWIHFGGSWRPTAYFRIRA